MSKVLKMVFQMPGSKTMTWTLADPKTNLTKNQVTVALNNILSESMIVVNEVEPEGIKKLYVYETNEIELE